MTKPVNFFDSRLSRKKLVFAFAILQFCKNSKKLLFMRTENRESNSFFTNVVDEIVIDALSNENKITTVPVALKKLLLR